MYNFMALNIVKLFSHQHHPSQNSINHAKLKFCITESISEAPFLFAFHSCLSCSTRNLYKDIFIFSYLDYLT